MAVDTNIYDQRFFENTIKFENASAKNVVDILKKHFNPKSIIDIGCGAGIYLEKFKQKGINVLGYDGSPVAIKMSLIGDKIKQHDLCVSLKLKKRFDLCLCIEVAEHLPIECANILISSLVKLSPIIIFTAATPGQGPKSIGHINEQPHNFWIKQFKDKNFIYRKKITETIKKKMKNKNVIWWIIKNLMIFEKL